MNSNSMFSSIMLRAVMCMSMCIGVYGAGEIESEAPRDTQLVLRRPDDTAHASDCDNIFARLFPDIPPMTKEDVAKQSFDAVKAHFVSCMEDGFCTHCDGGDTAVELHRYIPAIKRECIRLIENQIQEIEEDLNNIITSHTSFQVIISVLMLCSRYTSITYDHVSHELWGTPYASQNGATEVICNLDEFLQMIEDISGSSTTISNIRRIIINMLVGLDSVQRSDTTSDFIKGLSYILFHILNIFKLIDPDGTPSIINKIQVMMERFPLHKQNQNDSHGDSHSDISTAASSTEQPEEQRLFESNATCFMQYIICLMRVKGEIEYKPDSKSPTIHIGYDINGKIRIYTDYTNTPDYHTATTDTSDSDNPNTGPLQRLNIRLDTATQI